MTILLAEDEAAVRELVRRLLEAQGHEVLAARDGREALDLAARHPGTIDLLVTDFAMPELDGPELVHALERSRPDVRVVVMSGYTDDEIVRQGLHRADVALLRKPFTAAQLADAVRRATEG